MKRITTLLALLSLSFGMAQAQNVFFAGQYGDTAKILKNNTLIYSISDTIGIHVAAMHVANDSTVFTAGHSFSTAFSQGRVWQNDACIFVGDTNTSITKMLFNGNDWIAAGGNIVWQNGTMLHSYFIDSAAVCNIYALAIDTMTGDIYAGGSASNPAVHASIWKNDALFWQDSSWSCINDMQFDGENLFAAGFRYDNGTIHGIIWQNDSIVFQLEEADFKAVAIYENLYWAGIIGDNVYVWQDGEVLYSHPNSTSINALCVNEYGVYYAGTTDGVATIWKDGEILYQPEDCWVINALCVMPAPLPPPTFTITVEADNTDWGTVSGGGEYHLGDTATAFASPNPGYEFLFWNDSITDNPIDVIVLSDSTFKAYFGLVEYLIETAVTPEGSGIVTGGGTYHYGDTVELMATANPGFEFISWIDSVTDNPRTVIVTESQICTAVFGFNQCLIQTEVRPEGAGSVDGGGLYDYGSIVLLTAHNNPGYDFARWDDGVTDNPRSILVEGNATYIAEFNVLEYEITTLCDPENGGTVTGGGIYHFGDTAVLNVTANVGFGFVRWNDGNTDNPRTVVVRENHSYTAVFGIQQCQIETSVTPEGAGTVIGGGLYDYGSTILLAANNNPGYVFDQWSDQVTDNPRSVFVESDSTFTAIFTPLAYEITTSSSPEGSGTVTGGGTYHYGDTAILTATPHPDFTFVCWSDGNASNPRSVIVTKDADFTAMFYLNGPENFTVTALANDSLLGTVEGSGSYPAGALIPISATPNDNAYFKNWDDGIIDNPRFVEVTQDTTFTAIFVEKEIYYTVTVKSENPLMGMVYGGGMYITNTVVNIGATPNSGFRFTRWQDGNTDNPRLVTVTADTVYTAFFEIKPTQHYTISVYFDENQGFVMGAGTYEEGATATLAAIPNDGHLFTKWSDENTENPRKIVVDQDLFLAAFFSTNDVDEYGNIVSKPYPNPADQYIRIDGAMEGSEISIFNAKGLLVKTLTLNGDTIIPIGDLTTGLYLLRMGSLNFKFMKH